MKAWVIESLEGIDKLKLMDVPDPRPGRGEVALDMLYAALNPADRYLAQREYPADPPLPHVLGRDGLGVVREIGEGVSGIRPGEKRAILRGETGVTRWGTFAQRVVVAGDSLVEIPPGWTEQEAAGATLVYLTAYQALSMWGELRDAVVLISGASGGVGVAALQLASAMGHRVAALSRSREKRDRLVQLGATFAIDPNDPTWTSQLKQMPAAGRVDLIVDNVGGALFSEMLDTLGYGGKVSCVGRLAGPVPQFNTAALLFRRLRIDRKSVV